MDLIRDADRAYLRSLQEHADAPQFNWTWTDQLTADGLELVRLYEARLASHPPIWNWGEQPPWVGDFKQACQQLVPFFRGRPAEASMSRLDVRDNPDSLIPDGSDTRDMTYHETSGTTGNKVRIYGHPAAGECYLPLLRKALRRSGVDFTPGPERVCLMLVFHHTTTLTYPQVCPVLDGAAFLRLNLHPGHWKDPESRLRYLDYCAPQVFTGTPLSLMELAKFPIKTRPRALVTTSMAMLPGTRKELEEHFQCPLIDLYSMAECRCIAARSDNGWFELLAHDLFVEILDEQGTLCPPGEPGEVTLTGGRNPYLPLLRYRTGDFAAMVWDDQGRPWLKDIEGRAPVAFATADGTRRNNMEVTRTLADLPLTQFSLHQNPDGSLDFRFRGPHDLIAPVRERLSRLLAQPLRVECVEGSLGPKWIAYSTAMD
ncbi:MAG: AMP-binding protein [Vulcanimicrobiota bacterium]